MGNAQWPMESDFSRRQSMHLKKIAFSVFLLCSFAATVTAQKQTIEYGSADELKGVEKIFVDAKADMSVRDKILAEIRKKLRAVKRELIIVSKPEESDIHLRFHYEWETAHGEGPAYPTRLTIKIPVGTVVKILGKDRVRLLMSYSFTRPNFATGVGWDRRKHEVEFAREFAQAYLAANPQKQGQPARLLSSY
jgi:endo-1,4-beta-mannosidase